MLGISSSFGELKMPPRQRRQKEQEAPAAPEVPEHKENVQKGVPKHVEKGRQDTRNENKAKSTTKTHAEGNQGDAAAAAKKHNVDGHNPNIQPKRNQPQCLNINTFTLFLVVVVAVFAVVFAVCVWQMNGHYKMEIETLKRKVITMEKTNADELDKLRKEIQGLTSSVKNAATKQYVNNKIEQLETKLKSKLKGQ